MKITKSQLKELIREQVRGVIEEDDDEWFELGGERERPPMEGQLTASLVDRYGSDEQFKAALDDVLGPPGSGEDIWETIDKFTKFMEEYIPNPNVESGEEEEPIEEKKKKSKGKRTAKDNITQDTREKYATVGKDGFPIFDKKSAKAAIDLRGHASAADQKKIINKAAKYAPAAAKKARKVEKKK